MAMLASPAGLSVTLKSAPKKSIKLAPLVMVTSPSWTSMLPPPPPVSAAQFQAVPFHLRIWLAVQLRSSDRLPLAVDSPLPLARSRPISSLVALSPSPTATLRVTDPEAPPPIKPVPARTSVISPLPPLPLVVMGPDSTVVPLLDLGMVPGAKSAAVMEPSLMLLPVRGRMAMLPSS